MGYYVAHIDCAIGKNIECEIEPIQTHIHNSHADTYR